MLSQSPVYGQRHSHAVIVGVCSPFAGRLLEADHDLKDIGHGRLEAAPRVENPYAGHKGRNLLVVGLVVVGSPGPRSILHNKKYIRLQNRRYNSFGLERDRSRAGELELPLLVGTHVNTC
jgi:hypothetical protein